MSNDQVGVIIISMLCGGIFTFLGWVSKSQNAGDMVNFFDEKKYDKKKFSKIFGEHFLFIGIGAFVLGIIGVIFRPKIFMFLQVILILLGIVKTLYAIEKYSKI